MSFGIDFGPYLQALVTFGGICGIFGLFGFWQASLIGPFRDELNANPATRHDAACRLTDRRWWGPYRRALNGGLRRLDRWMGKPEQLRRGFSWCLALAFAYPVLTLVLAWTFGVSATLGDTELLEAPETLGWWQRALVLLAILVAAGVGTVARPRVVFLILALALALSLVGAKFRAGAITLALAVVVIFVGLLSDRLVSDVQVTAFVLFWLILPWLNAAFDLISWQVSRRLGRHLLGQLDGDDRGWLRRLWDNPLTHMAADIFAAGFLLFGLAWALPAVIRAYNGMIESLGSSVPLVLDGYLCTAAQDPLGAGIWATVMLISTLVPTLIHLGFVFASPFIAMFKPHPAWDARAAHLEGRGLPPAVDLRGTPAARLSTYDPRSRQAGLAEDGEPWLPQLHPETTKAIAWELRVVQPVLQLIMFAAVGVLLLDLVLAWDSIWTPVPAWLLWVAHGFDAAPVQACLGVWL